MPFLPAKAFTCNKCLKLFSDREAIVVGFGIASQLTFCDSLCASEWLGVNVVPQPKKEENPIVFSGYKVTTRLL